MTTTDLLLIFCSEIYSDMPASGTNFFEYQFPISAYFSEAICSLHFIQQKFLKRFSFLPCVLHAPRRMSCAGHVTRIGQLCNRTKCWFEKPKEKRQLYRNELMER